MQSDALNLDECAGSTTEADMRPDNIPTVRAYLLLVFAIGVIAFVVIRPAHGQGPERQQEFQVPGLGARLKVGWQVLVHDDCRYAVPERWRPSANGDIAFALDGSRISVQHLQMTNWSVHRSRVKAAYGRRAITREDSDRRLWLEIHDDLSVEHYVDVVDGSGACVGLLVVPTATQMNADDINRIADGIGPVPADWPPNLTRAGHAPLPPLLTPRR